MPWKLGVALAIVGLWLYGIGTGQGWASRWEILAIAWGLFAGYNKERYEASQPTPTGQQSKFSEALGALFEPASSDDDDDTDEPFSAPHGSTTEGFLLSDEDYHRLVSTLRSQIPFLEGLPLFDPAWRRQLEGQIVSGQGYDEVIRYWSAAAGQPAETPAFGQRLMVQDPQLQAAHESNRRMIEGLIAVLPVSKNTALLHEGAAERRRRSFHPQARMVPMGLRAAAQMRHRRLAPSRMLREYHLARSTMLHTALDSLQPLKAPPARPDANGQLTGAPLIMRTAPPPFVR